MLKMAMSCSMSDNEISFMKKKIAWNHELDRKYGPHLCRDGALRMKLTEEWQIEEFLNDWKELANITWRVFRTYPTGMSAGKKNTYYKQFRCQSSSIGVRSNVLKPHKKHSGCQAKMTVRIKRTVLKRRGASRSKDEHLPTYPTIIELYNRHNHAIDSVDNLRFKDVCAEVKNKFLRLFQAGHLPSSALNIHKTDLQIEHKDDYLFVAADRSKCPDLQWCYRLYRNFETSLSLENIANIHYANEETEEDANEEIMEIISVNNINEETLEDADINSIDEETIEIVDISSLDEETIEVTDVNSDFEEKKENERLLAPSAALELTDTERRKCVLLYSKLFLEYVEATSKTVTGLRACETFLKTFLNLKTDASIHSAMHNFGNSSRIRRKN